MVPGCQSTCVGGHRRCATCQRDEEQFCPEVIFTYGGVDRDGTPTQGGYATKITVDEHFGPATGQYTDFTTH